MTFKAREERDTAREPAGGVHFSAASDAFVNKGKRLYVVSFSDISLCDDGY